MRVIVGLAILSVCLLAAAGLIVAGCGAHGHPSVVNSKCADGCELLYKGCGAAITEANGNQLTENQCAHVCDDGDLSGCVVVCNDSIDANNDCTTFGKCITKCFAGS
jgi:hypothetical protein